MKPVKDESELTEAMIERALVLLAFVVEKYGDRFMCLYERMEKKLAEVRARGNTRARIRARLGQASGHTGPPGPLTGSAATS